MVKLIVTDVDDTLVPEAGSVITPEYYDIIHECRKSISDINEITI